MDDLFSSDLSQTQSTKTSTFSDGQHSSQVIRKCSLEDVPLIVSLGRDFHEYSIWGNIDFDTQAVEKLAVALVSGAGVVFTNGTGFIAGMLSPLFFAPSKLIGTELAWWAPSGGGRELREAFEDWCRQKGASKVQCSALADQAFGDVNKNFNNAGYQLAELSYVKVL